MHIIKKIKDKNNPKLFFIKSRQGQDGSPSESFLKNQISSSNDFGSKKFNYKK